MSIKVSVCIPVYGVEKYIERCARSLFEQTMRDGIEFVFVNDCTPDKSIEILEKVLSEYPYRKEQTKIIDHEQNGGLVSARKTGLAHASGEYIIHCDSDDWVEPDMYEKMYNAAKENCADICYCPYLLDDGKTFTKTADIAICSSAQELLQQILNSNLHWNVWAKLVKKEIAKSSGLYQPEHICFGEDLLLSGQMLACSERVVCCSEPLYHYFKANSDSYTKTFKRSSFDQLAEAVGFLDKQFSGQYDLTVCKAEVLFKAVFYDLMTRMEFKKYSYNQRKKILSSGTLSRCKKLILFCAFLNYPLSAFFCKILRRLIGR